MKVGFVAVLGRPNAGKSTFLNAMLSKKVSIVSPKAQTTRDAISGVYNDSTHQIVFVDTPGIFQGEAALDRFMRRSAFEAGKDVNAILYLFDASVPSFEEDFKIIDSLSKKTPLVLCFNKIDLITIQEGEEKKKQIKEKYPDAVLLETSFLTNFGLAEVKEALEPYLEEGEPYYPEGVITDKDLSFQAKEIIRQEMLHFLHQEIPHQSAVLIDSFAEKKGGYAIKARILLAKKNHKKIVIGKGGEMIKAISMASRQEMERVFHHRILNLELEVKVDEDWRNNPALLQELGYAGE